MARILIIDDDEIFLTTLAAVLMAERHTVVTAGNGLSGAKLFRAEPFDLVITDIVMPDREGLETVMALKKDFPEIRVIAMSGGNARSKIYLDIAARLGADHVLVKSFTAETLIQTIAQVMAAPPKS